ncbi:YcdB/YcdC domain-containing protein [Peptoniphilus indolicus]|uniref:YcdB/YcdC repeated domain-containing protein n=2 Tax=Peptoniphilus indolicus TaxID=33030 RepID=A0A379DAW1_9FIRM|nr:YcdB/YcdC domain-containing protein [Peptoniphilus indolicus]SUB74655.1 Uncharacterised protein [Peptoniphilus indolicus]
MKKIISSLLIVFLFTNYIYATSNSKEILKIKNIFGVTDATEFNITTSEDTYDDGSAFKTLDYHWKNNDTQYNVSTDTSGNIFKYDVNYSDKKDEFKFLTKEETIKIASDFMNKLDPNLIKQYRLRDIQTYVKNGSSTLYFNRYVNDTIISNDSITIDVFFNSKSVCSFERTNSSSKFKDENFPKLEDALPKKNIFSNIENTNPLRLSYLVTGDEKKQIGTLVYTHLLDTKPLDATTAKPIVTYNNNYKDSSKTDGTLALNDVEITEIEKIKNLKPEKEVQSFIKKNFNTKDLKLDSKQLMLDKNKNYYYLFYYSTPKDSSIRSISVSVDAKDLSLLSFNEYTINTDNDSEISKKEAINLASKFLKNFKHAKNIDENNPVTLSSEGITTILYPRIENNIAVYSEGITILVDNSSKKVFDYKTNFSNAKFPAKSNIINLEKAKEFAMNDFGLSYGYVGSKPTLIYSYKNGNTILRASDGTPISIVGDEIQNPEINYENLEKSKYKDEITMLTDLGIGFYNLKDLQRSITIKEFINLMESIDSVTTKAIDYSFIPSQYEDLNQSDLENILTYKNAIKWILNSKGINNFKNTTEIWDKTIFKDYDNIEKEYLAYYYIAKSKGIYDKNESFQNQNISADEILHLIYNAVIKNRKI